MKFRLIDTKMLNDFLVNAKEREYQFWERSSKLTIATTEIYRLKKGKTQPKQNGHTIIVFQFDTIQTSTLY